MKKIKIAAMPAAILLALILAWTTRQPPLGSKNPPPGSKNFDCTGVQNYYFNGTSYLPVGQFGVNYYCAEGGDVCTYYKVSQGVYAACRLGAYTPIYPRKK